MFNQWCTSICERFAVVLLVCIIYPKTLQWRHNEHGGVSNHRRLDDLLNRLFRRRSKKTSKLRVTGLCLGNSPVTGEVPAQRASDAENVYIWLTIDFDRQPLCQWRERLLGLGNTGYLLRITFIFDRYRCCGSLFKCECGSEEVVSYFLQCPQRNS